MRKVVLHVLMTSIVALCSKFTSKAVTDLDSQRLNLDNLSGGVKGTLLTGHVPCPPACILPELSMVFHMQHQAKHLTSSANIMRDSQSHQKHSDSSIATAACMRPICSLLNLRAGVSSLVQSCLHLQRCSRLAADQSGTKAGAPRHSDLWLELASLLQGWVSWLLCDGYILPPPEG